MTTRAVAIGLVCVALLALVIPYSDLLVRGSWFGLTAFPIGSLLALLAVVLIAGVGLRLAKRGLKPPELALIACMALVGAGIPSFGLTGLLLPYLAGPTYFMTQERPDDSFLPLLPRWAMVQGDVAPGERISTPVAGFYEGWSGGPLPWADWAGPLGFWAIQIAAVYLVFFCLVSLFRKPWLRDERLVFPLAELPAAIVSEEGQSPAALVPAFFRSGLMWCFFLAPLLIHGLNGLNHYYPSIPRININQIQVDALLFTEHPWNKLGPFWVRVPFCIVGIAYFLPLSVARSLWVFYFVFMLQTFIGAQAGYTMPMVQAYPVRAFVGQQMWGGILVSGLYLVWTARRHIKATFRAAVSGAGPPDGESELLSPRQALIGILLGVAVICAWGQRAGAGLAATAIVFGLYFLTHLVAVRLVCEGGMLYVQHPYRPLNFLLSCVGTSRLQRSQIPMLALFDHVWMLDNRSPLMPPLMLTQRIADAAGLTRRRMAPALAAALVVAAVCSVYAYLRVVYEYGGRQLDPWFTEYYSYTLFSRWSQDLVTVGSPPDPTGVWVMGAGAATFMGVLKLYHAYPKWALHPIGFLMGASWPMINFWFPVMLAWLIKGAVLRVGGVTLYRRLAPGFLGLILSEFICAALWTIIGVVTRSETAYQVFAI